MVRMITAARSAPAGEIAPVASMPSTAGHPHVHQHDVRTQPRDRATASAPSPPRRPPRCPARRRGSCRSPVRTSVLVVREQHAGSSRGPLDRQPRADTEAAARAGPASSSPPSNADALAHAGEPVAAGGRRRRRRPRRRSTSTSLRSPRRQRRRRRVTPACRAHVGEGLLHDPVRRQLDARGNRISVPFLLEEDGQPGGAMLIYKPGNSRATAADGGRRCFRIAQYRQDPRSSTTLCSPVASTLASVLAACQGRLQHVASAVARRAASPDRMGDDVVKLAGDRGALFVDGERASCSHSRARSVRAWGAARRWLRRPPAQLPAVSGTPADAPTTTACGRPPRPAVTIGQRHVTTATVTASAGSEHGDRGRASGGKEGDQTRRAPLGPPRAPRSRPPPRGHCRAPPVAHPAEYERSARRYGHGHGRRSPRTRRRAGCQLRHRWPRPRSRRPAAHARRLMD